MTEELFALCTILAATGAVFALLAFVADELSARARRKAIAGRCHCPTRVGMGWKS
jgi:hypothetical protein